MEHLGISISFSEHICMCIYIYIICICEQQRCFDLEQVNCAHLLTSQMLTLLIIYSGGPLLPSLIFPLCAVETPTLCT